MRAFDAPTHKYTHARMHSETDTSQLAIERGSELTRGSADRTSSSLARSLCGPLPCLPLSSSWPRPTVAVGRVATAAAAHLSDTLFLPLLSRSGGRWVGLSLAHPTRPVDSLSFSSQASFPLCDGQASGHGGRGHAAAAHALFPHYLSGRLPPSVSIRGRSVSRLANVLRAAAFFHSKGTNVYAVRVRACIPSPCPRPVPRSLPPSLRRSSSSFFLRRPH